MEVLNFIMIFSSSALVIAGGTNSILDDIYISNRVELFKPDSVTGTVTSCLLPNLPSKRTEPTVDIVNEKLMVCGGDGGEYSCLSLVNKGDCYTKKIFIYYQMHF
jgi:hypothetical protein